MRTRLACLAASLIAAACSSPAPSTDPRTRLGIPADAKEVLIFDQTSHLDIDWQQTFDAYYQNWVTNVFSDARQILDQQQRAYYSVAEMAYLEHHLQAHPEELAPMVAHGQSGALRIVGGGMTSPDTLLPEVELLVRDYLHGAIFSEGTLGLRPTAAWLPDSFGHAATAPDVLAAAGFSSVGFARIDGAPTLYQSLIGNAAAQLRPGSHAQMLQQLGSADFVWRGPGGGEVLAHYVAAGLYCTGDNMDYNEVITIPGVQTGVFEGDDPTYVDGKIDTYLQKLRPYARTPFIFVPVGCDFQQPKQQLLSYLDGYNQRHYGSTGTFAVAASFEDYIALISSYRAQLPVISAELSPYFMGFYGSRADIKQGVRAAARPFFTAETFAAGLGAQGAAVMQAAAPALHLLTRADHHDFVTGTSADPVVQNEQLPLLAQTQAAGQTALVAVAAALAKGVPALPDQGGQGGQGGPGSGPVGRVLALNAAGTTQTQVVDVAMSFNPPLAALALHAVAAGQPVPLEVVASTPAGAGYGTATLRLQVQDLAPLSFRAIDVLPGAAGMAGVAVGLSLLDANGAPASGVAVARAVLQNEHVRAQWDRVTSIGGGFALTSLMFDGVESLSGPSFTISDYADQGGLWRLGNEMPGCSLTLQKAPVGDGPGQTATALDDTALGAGVAFQSGSAVREAWLYAGSDALDLVLTTGAAEGTTRTASFSFAAGAAPVALRTAQAGGYVERTADSIYTPTFWPAVSWLSAGPFAVLLRQSSGVHFSADGLAELMAARNAVSEHCDVLGGTGTDSGTHRIEWRIAPAASPVAAERAAQAFNRPVVLLPVSPGQAVAGALPTDTPLVQIDGDSVLSTIKPADRGAGVILRVLLMPGPATVHLAPALAALKATRTDTSERDLEALGSAAALTLDNAHFGAIATVRLSP